MKAGSEQTKREEFEKDADTYGYNLEKAGCGCCDYFDRDTEHRWRGFEAATEASDAKWQARVKELEEALEESTTVNKLIDVWVSENGKQISWGKAIEITSIVMKLPSDERVRLLCMDEPNVQEENIRLMAMLANKTQAMQLVDDSSEECEGDDGELVFTISADAMHLLREALSTTSTDKALQRDRLETRIDEQVNHPNTDFRVKLLRAELAALEGEKV